MRATISASSSVGHPSSAKSWHDKAAAPSVSYVSRVKFQKLKTLGEKLSWKTFLEFILTVLQLLDFFLKGFILS